MERKKASDFPPEVMELFDGYVHGTVSRRDFLDRAAAYTKHTKGLLEQIKVCNSVYHMAFPIEKDDGTIEVTTGTLTLAGLSNLSGNTLTGGTYRVTTQATATLQERGTCALPDGWKCEAQAYYLGACPSRPH